MVFQGRSDVDVAILEIGLGGRLDAFNVVDARRCSHHQHWAGPPGIFRRHARALIGAEKAGILRAGQQVVLGADMPAERLRRVRTTMALPTLWQVGVDLQH